ncbi:MAG: alpha/beta hydrolase [bacterium]|nr:alpha/beta hydrolase [bacterium]
MRRLLFFAVFVALTAVLCRPVSVYSADGQAPAQSPAPSTYKAPIKQPRLALQDIEVLRDVEFGKGGDKPLLMDILRPSVPQAVPMPVLIWIHGGGWQNGDKRPGLMQLTPFAKKGYFCASINYRLSDEAVFPAQIEDCKCAVRYLRANAAKYGLDPAHIGVWGASAGGHLAALLGTSGGVSSLEGKGGRQDQSSRVQAVCDWFGPSDLTVLSGERRFADGKNPVAKLLGGPVAENKEKAIAASPVTWADHEDPPFLIMHGTADKTVPYGQSVRLKEVLDKAGVTAELVTLEGAGHGGKEFVAPEQVERIMKFFDRWLKAAPEPAGKQ